MFEKMVEQILKKLLETVYPHLLKPAILHARILKAERGAAWDGEMELVDPETEESFTGRYRGYWYTYTIEILDRFGNADAKFGKIPGIRCKQQYAPGSVVAVALPNGELTPAIIGEVVL